MLASLRRKTSEKNDDVPTLLNQSFEAWFEVFYNDLLCRATPSTVMFVRDWIEEHLVGLQIEGIIR